MDKKSVKKVFLRDFNSCWHCGTSDETLILHHRQNRGMGGSPSRDVLSNVILICSRYNGQIEDSAFWAQRAREQGHKLLSWQNPAESPCFDVNTQTWYLLDNLGNRHNLEESELQ